MLEKPTNVETFKELSQQFSLIPLIGKTPVDKNWQQWCETKRPFILNDFQGKNAGIPCGPGNGILVVDVDDVEKFNTFLDKHKYTLPLTRVHVTGSGKPHYLYQYPNDGKKYGCRALKDQGFDIRGLGGQIVAPGSIHPDTGKPYEIRSDKEPGAAPQWLLDLALKKDAPQVQPKPGFDGGTERLFINRTLRRVIEAGEKQGERSETIFAVLGQLVNSGASDSQIIELFEKYPIGAKYREKGNTREQWLLSQVNKIKAENGGVNGFSAGKLKLWIDQAPGTFSIQDIRNELSIFNPKDINSLYVNLKRLETEGVIEKQGTKRGVYRRIEKDVQVMDFLNIEGQDIDLWLPFEINNLVRLYPGNIILLAGEVESGKTAINLNIVRHNMDAWAVHYFNSEMGAVELRERLLLFDDLDLKDWKFRAIERSENFQDVIVQGPGNLNIIDFLELTQDFYMVGSEISKIHKRLEGAVAIISIQKNPGVDHGLGGWRAYEKPRLALNISQNAIEIVKCKNFRGASSPRGKKYFFKINNGCRIEKN